MPTKKKQDDNTVAVDVFVPCGKVAKDAILSTALNAVRDSIPVVYDLTKEITAVSDVKTVDGKEGRDYTVTFTYKIRPTTDDQPEPVNLDRVSASLRVPTQEDYMAAVEASEEQHA